MKRLVIAVLAVATVCVVAGSALAAGNKTSVIFDTTNPNGPTTNMVSYGPAAYSYETIGDKITFKEGTGRNLSNVTVTLSSWACQTGSWNLVDGVNCVTQPGATFSQPITLSIYNVKEDGTKGSLISTSTKTFDVQYRPSTSSKCLTLEDSAGVIRPGGWYQSSSKTCKNGLAQDVTFGISKATLPETVVYEIAYNTGGPADSLNVAITDLNPTVGTSTDKGLWIDGALDPSFDEGWAFTKNVTPAVQFKTSG